MKRFLTMVLAIMALTLVASAAQATLSKHHCQKTFHLVSPCDCEGILQARAVHALRP